MKKLLTKITQVIKKMTTKDKWLLTLFFVLVVFTRFYNLTATARFTQDESSDLARMHEYYEDRRLSLVGPISSDRSKVFSSLGYYMLMPFAVAFHFTPVSPVYGMAFLGVLTAIFMFLLARAVNKKKLVLASILIIVWFPLVLMSRWAWNPHFVVFWGSLALLIYQYRRYFGNLAYFLLGLFFALMFHHHYVAVMSTAPFLFFISLPLIKQKKFKPVLYLLVGYILPHLAFILFDIKNPPGLFFGRYLTKGKTPHLEHQVTVMILWSNLVRNIKVFFSALIQSIYLQVLFTLSFITLILIELKNKTYQTLTWIVPATTIIFVGVFLDDFQIRYVFSSLIFIFVWLLLPRSKKLPNLLATISIYILIIGSLFSLKSQLTESEVQPTMKVFTQASEIISRTIKENKLNNVNVAALASKDDAPLAERYRDYIRMNHVGLRGETEYGVSEHLFVVTTADDMGLRNDKSYAMVAFEDKGLRGIFNIEDTNWKVIWYGTD